MMMLHIVLEQRRRNCSSHLVIYVVRVCLQYLEESKFYKVVIRPTILYEAKCWPVKYKDTLMDVWLYQEQ
uniref:Putative ovule protein n=1 Tax=Solanum chacoense TaxID=4108 RepID=A0A0V0GZS2_SOLCH